MSSQSLTIWRGSALENLTMSARTVTFFSPIRSILSGFGLSMVVTDQSTVFGEEAVEHLLDSFVVFTGIFSEAAPVVGQAVEKVPDTLSDEAAAVLPPSLLGEQEGVQFLFELPFHGKSEVRLAKVERFGNKGKPGCRHYRPATLQVPEKTIVAGALECQAARPFLTIPPVDDECLPWKMTELFRGRSPNRG